MPAIFIGGSNSTSIIEHEARVRLAWEAARICAYSVEKRFKEKLRRVLNGKPAEERVEIRSTTGDVNPGISGFGSRERPQVRQPCD
jgi:hypothetical protein